MKSIPHPIQYQGSKRNLAPIILRYVPKDVNCLIEPFSGSAAISIAVAARLMAKSYLINDLNKPLAELLRLIVEFPIETDRFMRVFGMNNIAIQLSTITGFEKTSTAHKTLAFFYIY